MPASRTPEAGDDGAELRTGPNELPTLSTLQFLVLDLLSSQTGSASAFQLKQGLAQIAPGYDGPKFYQLMGRMVRDGLVVSEARMIATEGGAIERTFYASTNAGAESLELTREFYTTRHRLQAALLAEQSAK